MSTTKAVSGLQERKVVSNMKNCFRKSAFGVLAVMLFCLVLMPQLTVTSKALSSLEEVLGSLELGGTDLGGSLDLGGLLPDINWPWEDDEEEENYDDGTLGGYYYEDDVVTTAPYYACGCHEHCPCNGGCDSQCVDCGPICGCTGKFFESAEYIPVKPIVVYDGIHNSGSGFFSLSFSTGDKLKITLADSRVLEFTYEKELYGGSFKAADGTDNYDMGISVYIYSNEYENGKWNVGTHNATVEFSKYDYPYSYSYSVLVPVTVKECPVKSISAEYKYTLYDGYSCNIGQYFWSNSFPGEYIICTVGFTDGSVKTMNCPELEEYFGLRTNIELELKSTGKNEGTIALGNVKGKFTVNVEKLPDIKILPQIASKGTDWYFFSGGSYTVQLIDIENNGYKNYYEIFDMPEGFTLSSDGKLSFTLPEDSAGEVYKLNFEIRWENIYVFYILDINIHSVDKKDSIKLPSAAEKLEYYTDYEVKADENNPRWYTFTAAANMIAINNGKAALYNSDGIIIYPSEYPMGDGPWLSQYRYSVLMGEQYYIRVANDIRLYVSLYDWLPSWHQEEGEDELISNSERELIKINESRTFEGDSNTLWNVYRVHCEYKEDVNAFNWWRFGIMDRYASPVDIHYETQSHKYNSKLLYFSENTYDPNGESASLMGVNREQETLKDELLPGEKEYRFDNVYYFLEEKTDTMTIEEDRLIYIPQGYVFSSDGVHVVKHRASEHTDKNNDTVCDMCGLDVNAPEEPTTEEPTTKEPTTEEPTTKEPEAQKPSESTEIKMGDTDGDNKITAADARNALRMSVGLEKTTAEIIRIADTDKDGKITAADARYILRASVGLEKIVILRNVPSTVSEIVELYKKGLGLIKQGKAGYTLKSYQSLDEVKVGGLVINKTISDIAEGMVILEKEAEEREFSKGSDQSMYMISDWTLSDYSMIKSAACVPVGENYEITITMKDEDTPKKYGSVLGQVTGNLTYWEDIECTLDNDPTIQKVLSSYDDIHVIYNNFTIRAVMTPDGKFISLEHNCDVDVLIGSAKILVFSVENKSMKFSNYFKCYDFVY